MGACTRVAFTIRPERYDFFPLPSSLFRVSALGPKGDVNSQSIDKLGGRVANTAGSTARVQVTRTQGALCCRGKSPRLCVPTRRHCQLRPLYTQLAAAFSTYFAIFPHCPRGGLCLSGLTG